MQSSHIKSLSGVVLERVAGVVQRERLTEGGKLTYRHPLGDSKWELYDFFSGVPLRGEDPELVLGPFVYPVVCRRSGPRVLVMSVTRDITDAAIGHDFDQLLVNERLNRVPIAVDSLVKAISERPTKYVLSFVHARVPAFGAALRSVSFYGDDLGEASLFRDHINIFNFFTCGLRPAVGGGEIVRLGSDGTVSFSNIDEDRVVEVERVLGFLRQGGYLPNDIIS